MKMENKIQGSGPLWEKWGCTDTVDEGMGGGLSLIRKILHLRLHFADVYGMLMAGR